MSAEAESAGPDSAAPQSHTFEADVSKLLHLMVHSVYSDKDVFLRELISNAADACEKLRYEALSNPALLGEDQKGTIRITLDADARRITIADNGIGMSAEEMIEALGTIARSGTKAFVERLETAQQAEGSQLIGQFGVGFYSTFMVADKVEVFSRRAGSDIANVWSSDGKGSYSVAPASLDEAPARGTRVVLHLMEDAKSYAETYTIENLIKTHSGHVPVPILLVDKPDAEPQQIGDGAALWTRPKSDISEADYTDFYRSVAGQFDDPALTIHFRAEGRQEYTMLAFVPGSRPFDLFDPQRKGRMKLYVRRVLITDEADLLPGYLRFVRGLIDSADLPLNVSREMIQESPLLTAIRKAATGRVLGDLDKLATSDAAAYAKVWENFGSVLKEGLYEDFERRDALLGLARFKSTASGGEWRSLKDYVAGLKDNQTAIYYLAGDDAKRLENSPHIEGFRARGIEVLLLSDPVDSFWVTSALGFEGKPFKSVTQGAADLDLIPLAEKPEEQTPEVSAAIASYIAYLKTTLGDDVSDVRASERLTSSAVCLVAPDNGMDKRMEQILASAGKLDGALQKPILEINPRHALVTRLATARESGGDAALIESATRLLLDEARILDGTVPTDPTGFAERLSQVLAKSLG
ncbi:molecular chaperone HtpG [Labrys sp. KNU-23]|uniref:molecular chaperone HtpG n=1 Tax=Labrys sp. KNU-23 TaxID=2789216 RepID=UPI0011EDAEF6|nr:molecular chaperone HtpG [Labrys sp. KNU-23]QEN89154.1 molecular chaperone HtpG [Labrys sp. KNU-23]